MFSALLTRWKENPRERRLSNLTIQDVGTDSTSERSFRRHFSADPDTPSLRVPLSLLLRVVSGSRDATLRVWDIETGQCLHVLMGHVAAVRCVQYDGRRVVSGAYDFMVKVWDPETETCLHTLQGHTNRVYSLQVSAPPTRYHHCVTGLLGLIDNLGEKGWFCLASCH